MLSIEPLQPEQVNYHWHEIQKRKRAFDDYTTLHYDEFVNFLSSPRVASFDLGSGRGLASFVFDGCNAFVQMVIYDYNYDDELVRNVCLCAFYLGAHRLTATASDNRVSAQELMVRMGMRREGLVRQAFERDGIYHDVYVYGALEGEFGNGSYSSRCSSSSGGSGGVGRGTSDLCASSNTSGEIGSVKYQSSLAPVCGSDE